MDTSRSVVHSMGTLSTESIKLMPYRESDEEKVPQSLIGFWMWTLNLSPEQIRLHLNPIPSPAYFSQVLHGIRRDARIEEQALTLLEEVAGFPLPEFDDTSDRL